MKIIAAADDVITTVGTCLSIFYPLPLSRLKQTALIFIGSDYDEKAYKYNNLQTGYISAAKTNKTNPHLTLLTS